MKRVIEYNQLIQIKYKLEIDLNDDKLDVIEDIITNSDDKYMKEDKIINIITNMPDISSYTNRVETYPISKIKYVDDYDVSLMK